MSKYKIEDIQPGDIVTLEFPDDHPSTYLRRATITGPITPNLFVAGYWLRGRVEYITNVERPEPVLPTEPGVYITEGYAHKAGEAVVFQRDSEAWSIPENHGYATDADVLRELEGLGESPASLVRLVPEVKVDRGELVALCKGAYTGYGTSNLFEAIADEVIRYLKEQSK